ncbi:DUF305 domain-containing protein [Yinghuangia sp. YIM S09857]|uniref:DUF305 domain-containing protein n=1 Tax=Yinghuangia sp. YIM S09857 TaxID=3436929 RepID=UPI003F537558
MTFRTKAVAFGAAGLIALPVLAACDSDDGKPAQPSAAPTVIGLPPAAVANPPADNSVEAGFARDMKEHHAQAVEMSMIVRVQTEDEDIRSLAYDIATTQQNQEGQMFGWLDLWGLTQTTTGPPMTWMSPEGMTAMGHNMGTPGPDAPRMPGMATKAEMERLRQAKGREAEVLFLQLMIKHHAAGVAMAQDAANRATVPQVKSLAQKMVNGQTSEMDLMRDLLAERGA